MVEELSKESAWQPIFSAPFDRDLQLSVISDDSVHALAVRCRRVIGGWINAETKERIEFWPTHWREWTQRGNKAT